jgi:acyl-CoA thioester hydrolase
MRAAVGEIRGHVFHLPVRVYYEDTDAGGVVYYANYLKYLERARTEWLRAAGWDQSAIQRDAGLVFAVRRAELDFRAPAVLDDWLDVEAQLIHAGRASVTFGQVVRRGETELCHARVRVACLDAPTLTPRPLPRGLREVFLGDD